MPDPPPQPNCPAKTYEAILNTTLTTQTPNPKTQLISILEHLAHDLFCQAQTRPIDEPAHTWTKHQILTTLTNILNHPKYQPIQKGPKATATTILESLHTIPNLLTKTGQDHEYFSDQDLQSYLTARHLYRQQFEHPKHRQSLLPSNLLANLKYAAWHTVGIFYLCHAARQDTTDITPCLQQIAPDNGVGDEALLHFWIKLVATCEHHIADVYYDKLWSRLRRFAPKIQHLDAMSHQIAEQFPKLNPKHRKQLNEAMRETFTQTCKDLANTRKDLARDLYLAKGIPGFKACLDWPKLESWLESTAARCDGLILVLDMIDPHLPLTRHFKPYLWLDPTTFLQFNEDNLPPSHHAWLEDLKTLHCWARSLGLFHGSIIAQQWQEKITVFQDTFSRSDQHVLRRADSLALTRADAKALQRATAHSQFRAQALAITTALLAAKAMGNPRIGDLVRSESQSLLGQKASKLSYWLKQVPDVCAMGSHDSLIQIFASLGYRPDRDLPITALMASRAQERLGDPEAAYLRDIDDHRGDRVFFLACQREFFENHPDWQSLLSIDIPTDGPTISYDSLANQLKAALLADGVSLE